MTSKLPQRAAQHVTRDRAVTQTKLHLPREWVVRDQDGDTDYGIDLEVELAADVVTGWLFKAQVKGHDGIAWTQEGTFLQQVRPETLNYWRSLPVPVVMIVPDVAAAKTYWAIVDEAAEATGIRVTKDANLEVSANTLAADIIYRLRRRSGWALLNRAPSIENTWKELASQAGGDSFLDLDADLFQRLVDVYEDVSLLRQVVGLPTRGLLPWEVWIARSRVAFPKVETIAWGFFDEILIYFRPVVEETLKQSKELLREQDTTAENFAAKTWADTDPKTRSGTIHWYRSPLEDAAAEFWDGIESVLKNAVALKMPIADYVRKKT